MSIALRRYLESIPYPKISSCLIPEDERLTRRKNSFLYTYLATERQQSVELVLEENAYWQSKPPSLDFAEHVGSCTHSAKFETYGASCAIVDSHRRALAAHASQWERTCEMRSLCPHRLTGDSEIPLCGLSLEIHAD